MYIQCKYTYYKMGIFLVYTLGTPPPPSKSDKTLYTGIYLPTFREGTHFIIKLVVSCLGALTGPRESPSPLHTPLKLYMLHICYKILIKVYCVGYILLTFGEYISVEFLLLNIFCQILGGYMSFGGFLSWGPTVRGPTVRGPNCPGPNCPFFQGGQLDPGAKLSGA